MTDLERRHHRQVVRWLLAAALASSVAPAMFTPALAHPPHPGPARPEAEVAGPSPDLTAIDAAIEAAVERYDLPGIAVGVVVDGKVAHVRTLGETVAGSGDPVTPETLFKIASNSKAMTATVLARLVQQGKVRWDDPVVAHLPHFAMHDPWVTAHMTVRDLLVHNSGLPEGGGDLMLWPEPNRFTRLDITRGLRHIVPAYGFRAGYAYDNLLYVVAGEVAAAAGGAPYEVLVRREVFEPLGLDGCRVGAFDRTGLSVAQPHRHDGARAVPYRLDPPLVPEIASAAAGGIRCPLADMLAWARQWLAPTPAQLEWLGPAQREALWTAVTPMPVSQRRKAWNNTHVYAYALGFRLADANGDWTVSHTGTLGGMYSVMTLLPDLRSGYVVLINGEGDEARTVLDQVLLDRFTAPARTPTVARYAELLAAEPAPAGTAPVPDTTGRVPAAAADVAQWLGTWRDPWLGEATLCAEAGRVRFRVAKSPLLAGDLVRVGDRWLVDWHQDSVGVEPWMDFARDGDARTLAMAKVDPEADFSSDFEDLAFVRTGDCPAPAPRVSAARTAAAAGLVDVASLVPGIDTDIRYAGADNFTGAPVPGYEAPRCLLLRPAAEALAQVERDLRATGRRLRVLDCYRPTSAVARFVAWVAEPDDAAAKAAYYPRLDKAALLDGYIAPVSGHSRGATVDLTLLDCTGDGGCSPVDMGTPFDFFDPLANTDAPGLTPAQRRNRAALVEAMARRGFRNYPMEWWHFTLHPEPAPGVSHAAPVR